MNKFLICIACFLFLAGSSCEKEEPKPPVNPIPADYTSWNQPAGHPLEYPIPGHGKSRRIIFANKVALQAKIQKDENNNDAVNFPDGSIIVKEVYQQNNDGTFKTDPQLTVMVKDRNNKDAQKGWLFYVKNPGNEPPTLIKNLTCIGCHEAANENHPYFDNNLKSIFRDYVFINIAK